MNRFCDQFFSCAGLALDQNSAGQAGDCFNQFKNPLHRAAGPNDVVESVLFVQLLTQVLILESQVAFFKSFPDHNRQFDQLEWLREVIVSAFLDRADCRLDRSVTGDHNADDFGVSDERLFQKLDAGLSGEVVIGDQNIVGVL